MGFDGYLTKPTRALEVPQVLSLIWNAKLDGKNIPLVTRHMVQEAKVTSKKKVKLKNVHILLAEDNPVNQVVATEYLERYGCIVSPAGNGLEAITEFKNSTFDMVLMDCQMPEMDGYDATGVIRQWEDMRELNTTPIIAFTANAMQGDKEKCLSAGMDDYISKPVSEKSLEDILKKWLPDKVHFVDDKDNLAEETLISGGVVKYLDLSIFNPLKTMFRDKFPDVAEKHTSSAIENVKRIQMALDNHNANELEHASHSLKGASAQFGAITLSELSRQMEEFAKNAEFDKANKLFSKIKTERENVEKEMIRELEKS